MLSIVPPLDEVSMEQQTVHLYVPDTMADWEPGYAIAGINQPMYQAVPGRYRVRTVGATRDPVRTMGGVTILPELALEELSAEDCAMLILPGAATWDEGGNGAAAEKARELLDAGVPVAAICGATAGLARAGALDRRRHTSNAAEYLAAQPGYGGAAHYQEERAVLDGDLVTAGATAPADFAHRIFQRLEVYAPEVLDAWYRLHAHGDPSGFHALQAAEGA